MTPKLKVYELAKQLGVDNPALLEMCKRLGVDTKNSMSILGSEEVKSVREHYERNRIPTPKAPIAVPTTKSVTESRVGTRVIRRRSAPTDEVVEAPQVEEAPEPVFADEPEEAPVEKVVKAPGAPRFRPVVKRIAKPPPLPVEKDPEVPAPKVPSAEPLVVTVEVAPQETVADKRRRLVPSIIKKVSVEKHLGETIGPKRAQEKKVAAPATGTIALKPKEEEAGGLRRVKEVAIVPAADAAREAGKRRMLDRQNVVFRSADYLKRELVHATRKKKGTVARPQQKTQITTMAEHKRVVEMGSHIVVSEMARQMGVKVSALIKKLMEMGVTTTLNEKVDYETAALLSHDFGWEVHQEVFKEADFLPEADVKGGELTPRSPVITIMGHVDHGKTSLLDSIRKANVASAEAGGITQHIGAYTVTIPKKGMITFVDTPGHEAFTAMRARGAKVTDIVVLVVSAVDGVMPQTIESVNHAKAANVPIVVAINKTDLPDANPDRIKQTLAGHDLNPEEWGGNTIYANVSAKTGKGVPELLESILVQSEMLELKANFTVPARGIVIESRLDKSRGSLATVLIQHGVLKTGDLVVAGTAMGKVRAMVDCFGKQIKEAGPSTPVEILGLDDAAPVGEELIAVAEERDARSLVEGRVTKMRNEAAVSKPKLTLEEMLAVGGEGTKELRVVLKSDVVGSLEAIKVALGKIPDDKVKMKILHTATGGITESDVNLANASHAVILGFGIRPDSNARKKAEEDKVEIRTYSIIYEMVDEVKALMEGLLDKQVKETVIGHAEVRNIFNIPKVGVVAGSSVVDGKVTRTCWLRLLRDSRVVYEGKVGSLRRFKDDVKEVTTGYECGISVENFNDVKMGDRFEAYLKEEIKGAL